MIIRLKVPNKDFFKSSTSHFYDIFYNIKFNFKTTGFFFCVVLWGHPQPLMKRLIS